jgi:hypothetical protein
LWLFGIFSPFWYLCCTEKNLATLTIISLRCLLPRKTELTTRTGSGLKTFSGLWTHLVKLGPGLGFNEISKKVNPAALAQNPGPVGLGPRPDPGLFTTHLYIQSLRVFMSWGAKL